MQPFLEKRPKKRKRIHRSPCQPIMPVDGLCYNRLINSSILSETFSSVFIMPRRKNRTEMRYKKWVAIYLA